MRDILSELGVEPRGRGLVWLVAVFAAATLAVLTSEEAVIRAIGLPAIVLQFAVWSGWLVWLGYWFPRHRRQTLAKGPGGYRRAFYRDILPGVAVSFSQLSRPAWIGLLDSHLRLRWSDLLGAGLILVGLAVICWACRSIGIARVLFVYEYREGESWLVSRGSYRWIRHPLFVAGVLMSLGSAVLSWSWAAWWPALANALILPIYSAVEDRRCGLVLGHSYQEYCRSVAALVPSLRRFALRNPL